MQCDCFAYLFDNARYTVRSSAMEVCMSVGSTIPAALRIGDMERRCHQDHLLAIARYLSGNGQRMMLRLRADLNSNG